MPLFYLLLVAALQGLTEFLPVSSSGHLILLPKLTGMPDQGQIIDVAVHLGTLLAVIVYFWADLKPGFIGIPRMLTGRIQSAGEKLAFLLMIATIPAVVFGAILKITGLSDVMRSITVIGWTMIGFGVLLYIMDQRGAASKNSTDWTTRDAIKMGLWQAIALIPGTSRSGITITAARQLGYSRYGAAKLSMMMSVPSIFASGVYLGAEVALSADISAARDGAIAAVFSFLSALFALTLMMRLLRSVSFTPYVIYRIALGIILLAIAYT